MIINLYGDKFGYTETPVKAYDTYGKLHLIKPSDYHLYNFTSFQKLEICIEYDYRKPVLVVVKEL